MSLGAACRRFKRRRSGLMLCELIPVAASVPLTATVSTSRSRSSCTSALPSGPRNSDELHRWPEQLVDGSSEVRVSRAIANVKSGIVLLSDFSGMLCVETAMAMLLVELEARGVDTARVRVHRACDINKVSRRVMLAADGRTAPDHVFGCIKSQVPGPALKQLHLMHERFEMQIRSLIHQDMPHDEQQRIWERIGKKYMLKGLELLEASAFAEHGWCYKHNCLCPWNPARTEHDMVIAVAGSVCKDYSSFGKMLMNMGKHSVAFIVWVASLRKSLPDAILHENVVKFDWRLLIDLFGGSYKARCRSFSPLHFGYPMNRPRIYSALVRLVGWHFHDGYDGPEFEETFRRIAADGSIYFHDELTEYELEVVESMASKVGRCLVRPVDGRIGSAAREFLSGVHGVRLSRFEAIAEQRGTKGFEFLTNLQNRPTFHQQITAYVPTLMCSSFIFNSNLNRPMFRDELFLSMGMPVNSQQFERCASIFPLCSSADASTSLSENDARLLCGNGMHVPSVGTVLFWLLSSATRQTPELDDQSDQPVGAPGRD